MHRNIQAILITIFVLTGCHPKSSPEIEFWSWFQRNESQLFDFERDQDANFDRLSAELRKVHPNLTFEFGPKRGNQREFVISADGIREAFPKVESLFAVAPKLPRWKFIKFRPRRAPADLKFDGVTVKANTVRVALDRDGEKVGLTVFIPGYSEPEKNSYTGIAYLLLDHAIGEFDVETKVGYIHVQAPTPSRSNVSTLESLPIDFDKFLAFR